MDQTDILAAQKKKRRRTYIWSLLFAVWLLVGVYIFLYMWEHRHAVDEDGKSVLWKSYDRDQE